MRGRAWRPGARAAVGGRRGPGWRSPGHDRIFVVAMWRRFAGYGAVGWLLEVTLTGLTSVLTGRDRSATARTYLWMHPIYGLGGLLLERVAASPRVRRQPRLVRCLTYVPVMYGVEYSSG